MDQASRMFVRCDARDAIQLPRVEIHFAVEPGATLTWRAPSRAEIRTCGSRVWLTRSNSVDDYWMQPGDVVRLRRGERIWLSTDGPGTAEASITTAYTRRRNTLLGWFSRLRGFAADLAARRTG
ncbi:DUF2917 domain-containing protein [Burkholderia alba]|uniref:DUF2917 domain-containing protein n=1 Tax=Burkholderia alba TaxID=2683677 RepID=UPI002B05A7E6|nr:DUF2917 domain-containing protein [Burkholderia alba]